MRGMAARSCAGSTHSTSSFLKSFSAAISANVTARGFLGCMRPTVLWNGAPCRSAACRNDLRSDPNVGVLALFRE